MLKLQKLYYKTTKIHTKESSRVPETVKIVIHRICILVVMAKCEHTYHTSLTHVSCSCLWTFQQTIHYSTSIIDLFRTLSCARSNALPSFSPFVFYVVSILFFFQICHKLSLKTNSVPCFLFILGHFHTSSGIRFGPIEDQSCWTVVNLVFGPVSVHTARRQVPSNWSFIRWLEMFKRKKRIWNSSIETTSVCTDFVCYYLALVLLPNLTNQGNLIIWVPCGQSMLLHLPIIGSRPESLWCQIWGIC